VGEGLNESGIIAFCRDLACKAASPDRILLPALDFHWRYLRALENIE